jgi:hypothetical protein
MTHVIDKIAETTIEHIAHDKKLLTSWFAGRIDGDGSVHPTNHRIDIAYHKTYEAKLMRMEKALLHSMGVKTVKDRLLNGKNIAVVQICGLDNMIKLLDNKMSFRNRSKMLSSIARTKFYLGINRRFIDSLPDVYPNFIHKKNWNRYLNGSRRMPLSVFENTRGTLPVKHIESIRYGSKVISDKTAVRDILDARRLAGGEDVVRNNRICR